MNRKNNRKKKDILNKLHDVAAKNACIITASDLWGESVIAIDQSKKKLLYSNYATDANSYRIVDLLGIQKCEVIRSERQNGGIKKLNLQLAFGNSPDVSIEYYDEARNMALNQELELATKWMGIIKTSIK